MIKESLSFYEYAPNGPTQGNKNAPQGAKVAGQAKNNSGTSFFSYTNNEDLK